VWDSIIIGCGKRANADRTLTRLAPFFCLLAAGLAGPAVGLTLDLPAPVMAEERRTEAPGSYAMPIGPFDGQTVPFRTAKGAVDQRAYRLDAKGMTTLALMTPLRDQLVAGGYSIVFECEARGCGGFDFRFATDVMPEPDMHVDLGDFRFLSAEKSDETVSILVSRSAFSGFVQMTRVGALPLTEAPKVTAQAPAVADLGQPTDTAQGVAATGDLGASLDATGSVALDDLVFASGAAALEPGDYASLVALAAWMAANPAETIALVGHTDASGSLIANIALSERRAELVRRTLVDRYGVAEARVTSEGVGYLAPRASNQTETGRQKNRRVEAIVTSTR
jgi:outer membrane protein OmpA-like peptidoglycan-associated protein